MLVTGLVADLAIACGCPKSDALDALAWPEVSVFSARNVGLLELPGATLAVVEVDRVWSGTVFRHALVSIRVTSCGSPDLWTPGLENLLVIERSGLFGETNNCLGNEPLATAGVTLKRLGPGRPPLHERTVLAPLAMLGVGGGVLGARWLRARGRRRA